MSRIDIKIVAGTDAEDPVFASSRLLRGLSRKWDELLNAAETDDSGNKNIIYIPQIPQPVMENVIRYINATFVDPNPQPIPICDQNVQEYFSAGKFLEMEEIQTLCIDYLIARESTLENGTFLFKLMGEFDHPLVYSKIRQFFMQNADQLDKIVRKCKSEGISEDILIKLLVNWLNFKRGSNGMDLDVGLKKLLQEFSSTENKFKILDTFHQIGDLQGKNKAFSLLMNLAQNLSNSHHEERVNSAAATQKENDFSAELVNLEEFQVSDDDDDVLVIVPDSFKFQIDQLEQNEEFPSFTFVNECFFESEALRQEFRFISPLSSCAENQKKNWLCDPHSDCSNKFNLMEKDQPPVFIRKSPISGFGLFAKRRLVEGQVICSYTGKITKECADKVYPMDIYDGKKNKYIIDASKYGNWGRFANGELNATPNVEFDGVLGSDRAMVVLIVCREITPGEEVIAKYGRKYWENQKIEHINGKESGSSKSESLIVPGFASASTPRARKSCIKKKWTEAPETTTIYKNEFNKGKDYENWQRNKKVKIESCASSSFSSTLFVSPTFLSSSSESESELVQYLNTTNNTNKTNDVSAPQGIIYFLLGPRQNPQGLQFCSFNIKNQAQDFRLEGNLPEALNDRHRLAMLHHQGEIYFMGGEDCESEKASNEVHIFNLQSQEWRLKQMVECRMDFKAVVFNNYIYAVGGCLEHPGGPKYEEEGANTVEKLSLETPFSKWEFADFLKNIRSDAGLAVLNGKIYAIGGHVAKKVGGVMAASNLCESFNPTIRKSKGRWNSIAPLNYKRLGLSAVASSDCIFALGGAKSFDESDKGLKIVEIYDPVTNSWKDGPSMNRPRKFFSAVFFENCIYAIGGDDDKMPTMEKFSMEAQKWTIECSVKADWNFSTVAFS